MINVTRQIAFIHHRDHRLPGTPQLVEQLRRHFQMLGALRLEASHTLRITSALAASSNVD